MKGPFDTLPDELEALQVLARAQTQQLEAMTARTAQLAEAKQRVEQRNTYLESQVLSLQEQLNLALARRYAARSEKLTADQIPLFDEAEAEFTEAEPETVLEVSGHQRKKPGRKPLPNSLPRIDVVHELPEAERFCPHDGAALAEIGETVSEQLDIVPAKIQVIRHLRKKYACRCGQCIKTAPLPAQPIPKSLASPGLLAHVTVSKYQDALPLYRQEQILQRIGVDIPRATLANWMIQAGRLIQPLINLLRDRLLDYDIVQMDETTVQVLKEAGKKAQSKSYLWVQRGGPPDRPIILFDYDPSRSGSVPARLLAGYSGYLQTDGYDGYNAVVSVNVLVQVGCMAHARRRFSDAVKAQGKKKKHGIAHQGLAHIRKLYRIEKQAREMTAEKRHAYRNEHARPVLETLRAWLEKHLPQVPPQTATGKALSYLHNQWSALIRYLDDGRLEIDNNRIENAIRPFVVGRKNWLFSHSVRGVEASANLYSLIETAKANGLEPYAYTQLPAAGSVEDIEALLPFPTNKQVAA
jgi:transposase